MNDLTTLEQNSYNDQLGLTYDLQFHDDEHCDNGGFAMTLEDAKYYINKYNGTNESYFPDYKGGTVLIICNETLETVFETNILNDKC